MTSWHAQGQLFNLCVKFLRVVWCFDGGLCKDDRRLGCAAAPVRSPPSVLSPFRAAVPSWVAANILRFTHVVVQGHKPLFLPRNIYVGGKVVTLGCVRPKKTSQVRWTSLYRSSRLQFDMQHPALAVLRLTLEVSVTRAQINSHASL